MRGVAMEVGAKLIVCFHCHRFAIAAQRYYTVELFLYFSCLFVFIYRVYVFHRSMLLAALRTVGGEGRGGRKGRHFDDVV